MFLIFVILYLCLNRTCEKIVHYFLNTQQSFNKCGKVIILVFLDMQHTNIKAFCVTHCSFISTQPQAKTFALGCVEKYMSQGIG